MNLVYNTQMYCVTCWNTAQRQSTLVSKGVSSSGIIHQQHKYMYSEQPC